jgi:hypothetical protein
VRVEIDLNIEKFQSDWFSLGRENSVAVLLALKKIASLDWNQLYSDRGLRWEAIESDRGSQIKRVYSLRITGKFRAIAYRDGNVLRMLSLHPDHDSAYKK